MRRHTLSRLVITAVLLGMIGWLRDSTAGRRSGRRGRLHRGARSARADEPLIYEFNDALDTVIMRPAAKVYRFVVPGPVRTGVHNVLSSARRCN